MYPQQQQNPYSWTAGPPPAPEQKGCWGRNWKWIVPTGCLGLILLLIAGVAGIIYVAVSVLKSTEVYKNALEMARANTVVVEELGQPIEDGWYVIGSVENEAGDGRARLEIPITGPKKKGTLYVIAEVDDNVGGSRSWTYMQLEVEVEGRAERIDLLDPLTAGRPPLGVGVDNSNVSEEPPPPLPPASPGTISGGVLNGKAISKPEPPYPAIAKAARASGTVTVMVEVNEAGTVTSARAVSGHPLLQQAAVQAARQARFSPTRLSGKPVKVTGVLTYTFMLE